MDKKAFLAMIPVIAKEKNISEDSVFDAIKDAIKKGYIRQIKGNEEDALVDVDIDREKGDINITHRRIVVSDDLLEDYLEIPLKRAKEIDKKAVIDGQISEKIDLDDIQNISKMMAIAVKNVLNQKINEAEKAVLYETYHDKIGEMVTGQVERCDDRSATVKLGKTSVYLSRKEMIGDEQYKTGEIIRLYVEDVSSTTKGPQILVTRSDAGFLKRIFEEEIHEVYDGTVVIKAIARQAGVRSKVAVISLDENVDPVGACLGPGRTRLSRITAQLGNSKDLEKVDVLKYSENPGLYIIEAMRPASVVSLCLNNDKKSALVIVKDGQISLAIGRKYANLNLASQITGWELKVEEEKNLDKYENMVFKTLDDFTKEEAEKQKIDTYNKYLRSVKEKETIVSSTINNEEEAKSAIQPEIKLAETDSIKENQKQVEDEPIVTPSQKPVEVAKPIEKPIEKVEVKTTSTLESLEKELETEKKKSQNPYFDKKKFVKGKRPRTITDEEVGVVKDDKSDSSNSNKMDIYTEEELAELEEEENANKSSNDSNDEDIDYDEYDKYYDDEDKK